MHMQTRRLIAMSLSSPFVHLGDGKTATEYIDLMAQHNENKRGGRASRRNGGEL